MESPSERLDKAMDDRRLDLHLNWNDVATTAKVAPATLRAIRRGTSQPTPLTKRRLEDALQWVQGSIDAIYGGGDPTPLDEPPGREPGRATAEELEARVERLERELAALREERLQEREQENRQRRDIG